ncbi:hypothetical protein N799_07300, partial [Lysobacter arseniciresistens ZS79]
MEQVLREQGYSGQAAKKLISQARAELQQMAADSAAQPNTRNHDMSNTDVAETIGQLNTAFDQFKAHHTDELSGLRSEIESLATRAAAREMGNVTGPVTSATESGRAM